MTRSDTTHSGADSTHSTAKVDRTEEQKPWWKRFWRQWLRPLMVILFIAGSFRSAVADWNDVPTGSMKPTILEGDRIFVNKLAYDLKVPFTRYRVAAWGDPERGDIVVLDSPRDEKRLVKRVIGLPGDRIALYSNRLMINGEAVPYETASGTHFQEWWEGGSHLFVEALGEAHHAVQFDPNVGFYSNFSEVVVPRGKYFVMGDNRDQSLDSRVFGFVERGRILGRAQAVVASLDILNGFTPRWGRFFSPLE